MSDGVINLALLNFSGRRGNDIKGDPTKAIGANHFGFQVDDLAETQRRIESAGGTFFLELKQRTPARSSYPSSKVVTPNISPYGRTGGGP